MNDKPVMVFNDVVKVYPLPSGDVTALDDINFKVERGEFISVMGPSGSGKSTLLNLMGCLDTPDIRRYLHRRYPYRGHVGYRSDQSSERPDWIYIPVLQPVSPAQHHRERHLSHDAEIPESGGSRKRGRKCSGRYSLTIRSSLIHLQRFQVVSSNGSLSQGLSSMTRTFFSVTNQRVTLIQRTGAGIMELMSELNRKGTTIIMVTHDENIAAYSKRTIRIADGRIVE